MTATKVDRMIRRCALLAGLALALTIVCILVLGAAPARAGVTSPAEQTFTNPDRTYFQGNLFARSVSSTGRIEFPSKINVSSYPDSARVDEVTVSLHGMYSTFFDLSVVLVSPSGESVRLTEGCGGAEDSGGTISEKPRSDNITLKLDDAAPTGIPTDGAEVVPSGTYRPSQCADIYRQYYPDDMPASPGTTLADLDGSQANGEWRLVVTAGDYYTYEKTNISKGWTLNVSAHTPTDPRLGRYSDTKIGVGDDVTVTPSAPPKNATKLTVEASEEFTGEVSIDQQTGAVQVSNPGPVANHTLTVQATNEETGEVQTQPFVLDVKRQPEALVVDTPLLNESDGCFTGHCTLYEALDQANTNDNLKPDTITFDPEVFSTPQRIIVQNQEFPYQGLDIEDDVIIEGPGADKLTLDGDALPGNRRETKTISIQPDAGTVRLQDMTLTGGFGETGGVVDNRAGNTVELRRMFITRNAAEWLGGGIVNRSTMRLVDSTVSNNRVWEGSGWPLGSAIYNGGGGERADLTVLDSTISGNFDATAIDSDEGRRSSWSTRR